MNPFYFSIALAVGGNLLYHISQKSIPKAANPLITVMIAYMIAIVGCVIGLALFPSEKSWIDSVKESNWSVFTLGLGVAAVEIGFLLAYRSGWNISVLPILCSMLISLLLIPVGLLIFKEQLSLWNIAGIMFCMLGLFLVTKK
jgi:drug/metabolite transporter (DMT)-like permease